MASSSTESTTSSLVRTSLLIKLYNLVSGIIGLVGANKRNTCLICTFGAFLTINTVFSIYVFVSDLIEFNPDQKDYAINLAVNIILGLLMICLQVYCTLSVFSLRKEVLEQQGHQGHQAGDLEATNSPTGAKGDVL